MITQLLERFRFATRNTRFVVCWSRETWGKTTGDMTSHALLLTTTLQTEALEELFSE